MSTTVSQLNEYVEGRMYLLYNPQRLVTIKGKTTRQVVDPKTKNVTNHDALLVEACIVTMPIEGEITPGRAKSNALIEQSMLTAPELGATRTWQEKWSERGVGRIDPTKRVAVVMDKEFRPQCYVYWQDRPAKMETTSPVYGQECIGVDVTDAVLAWRAAEVEREAAEAEAAKQKAIDDATEKAAIKAQARVDAKQALKDKMKLEAEARKEYEDEQRAAAPPKPGRPRKTLASVAASEAAGQ